MDFELTAEQQALRARARELDDGVLPERAARWDEREEYPRGQRQGSRHGGVHGQDDPA